MDGRCDVVILNGSLASLHLHTSASGLEHGIHRLGVRICNSLCHDSVVRVRKPLREGAFDRSMVVAVLGYPAHIPVGIGCTGSVEISRYIY